MAEDRITHKEWLPKVENIKKNDRWITAAQRLGLRVANGGRHPYTIRDPKDLDDTSPRNLVTTVQSHLNRRINRIMLKEFITSPIVKRLGITEDDVWKALDIP